MGRLAVACRHLARAEQTGASRRLAPPRPPLRLGPLVVGVEAGASSGGELLALVRAPDQPIQRGRGLAQVLAQDQRLPVLLLGDGEHRNADVIALAPFSGLAALHLPLCGRRGGRPGL